MLNTRINNDLSDVLDAAGLTPLPDSVIDRDGLPMDISGSEWDFNTATSDGTFTWTGWGLANPLLAYAMKRYVIRAIVRNSPVEAYNTCRVFQELLSGAHYSPSQESDQPNNVSEKWLAIQVIEDPEQLTDELFQLLGLLMNRLRENKALYRFNRIRSWYNWAVDAMPGLGFSEEYALEMSQVSIPGNDQGQAVKTEDEEGGPLYDIEVRALINALSNDTSLKRGHAMQRAAVALCLKYGRNAANFCLMREEDFYDAHGDLPDLPKEADGFVIEPEWKLNIPRIKKRGIGARQDFIEESVDTLTVKHLQELIEANRAIDTKGLPRPLFMRDSANEKRINGPMKEYSFHITTYDFTAMLKAFAKRVKLISPRTGNPMHLTTRRLRYTFATTMVQLGASKEALARMLDHSNTRHVAVYFELKGKRLTQILDEAAAKKFSGYIKLFKGKLIDSDAEAVNGDNPGKHLDFVNEANPADKVEIGVCGLNPLCSLDPPFSCYLCSLFQPYRQADHEAVYAWLTSNRETHMKKYGPRLGVQLDDVLLAIMNVIEIIDKEKEIAADA